MVAGVEVGIIHLQGHVASGEIEGDGLVVPEQTALTKFQPSDGEGEELFDRSLGRKGAGPPRKVRGAVRIKDDVDDGLIENHFVKGELGTNQRADLQTGDNVFGVSQGNVGGGLAAMHRNIPHLDLQAKWDGVEAADFGAAAGNTLDFGDEATANQRLKGFRIHVDGEGDRDGSQRANDDQQVFPPAAGWFGYGLSHCDWTPESLEEDASPGMWT